MLRSVLIDAINTRVREHDSRMREWIEVIARGVNRGQGG